MNLSSKDLNLLYVFQILMEERNVSRAAKRLKLTQPAVSNALMRLRRDFNDPLLVRSSKGMVPTPLALEVWPRVKEFCEHASTVFLRESFDIGALEGVFRFATTDYFELVFLVKLLSFLQTHSPHISLVMKPGGGSFSISDLESGQTDFAAGGFIGELPEGFHSLELFQESYTCIVRSNHPLVKDSLDLETYLHLEHIHVTLQGELHGAVDRLLERKRLKRKVVAGVMSFQSPFAIIAASDYIATLPSRIAQLGAERYQLLCFKPPLDIPRFTVKLVWHARTHNSRPHVWMRQTLSRMVQEVLDPNQK